MPRKTKTAEVDANETAERAELKRLLDKYGTLPIVGGRDAAGNAVAVTAGTSKVPGSYAGAKVVVASKLANAIEVFLEKEETVQMRYQGSFWNEKRMVPRPDCPRYVISGTNYPIGAPPPGVIWPDAPPTVKIAGHVVAALTFGVLKDFWEQWIEVHQKDNMVKNNLIAAFDDEASARAWAREHQKQKSGFDPLVPDTDPRWPKKVTAIEARKVAQDDVAEDVAA